MAICVYPVFGLNYILVPYVQNYTSAKQYCFQEFGTQLASIHNDAQNTEASDLCAYSGYDNMPCWIGLTDLNVENEWLWEDESELTYTNWNIGEPNNIGSEDCVEILNNNQKWNDAECGDYRFILCNTPSPPTPAPSPSPASSPTDIFYSCGTNSIKYCYDVNLYPPDNNSDQLYYQDIYIQQPDHSDWVSMDITLTAQGNKCANPTINFVYEEIDYDSTWLNEYINVTIGNDVIQCKGQQFACGQYDVCFHEYHINDIDVGETYQISVALANHVDALCPHDLVINAVMTVICTPDPILPISTEVNDDDDMCNYYTFPHHDPDLQMPYVLETCNDYYFIEDVSFDLYCSDSNDTLYITFYWGSASLSGCQQGSSIATFPLGDYQMCDNLVDDTGCAYNQVTLERCNTTSIVQYRLNLLLDQCIQEEWFLTEYRSFLIEQVADGSLLWHYFADEVCAIPHSTGPYLTPDCTTTEVVSNITHKDIVQSIDDKIKL